MKILLVEDDLDTQGEISDLLNSLGHHSVDSGCAEEALQYIRSADPVDLILFDINMPGTSGLDMIKEIREDVSLGGEFLPAICMTGSRDVDLVVDLMRTGINDLLFKPLRPECVESSLSKVEMEISRLKSKESETKALNNKLDEREKLLQALAHELSESQSDSLFCLAYAAEHKDLCASAHLTRISEYARRMGELLGWSEERCSNLALAAPLHDVGKIGIPDRILRKTGKLTTDEFNYLKSHTTLGAEILSASNSPLMRLGAKIAQNHHENFDGSGYPNGLTGSQIPVEAMIISLLDVYDALRTSRPYRTALDHATAIDIMCNGDHRTDISKFHPDLLKVFLQHHHDFGQIYRLNRNDHALSFTKSAALH